MEYILAVARIGSSVVFAFSLFQIAFIQSALLRQCKYDAGPLSDFAFVRKGELGIVEF